MPFLNLAPLDNALATLKVSSAAYDAAFKAASAQGFALDAKRRAELNDRLRGLE